jgi:hypothetical protein
MVLLIQMSDGLFAWLFVKKQQYEGCVGRVAQSVQRLATGWTVRGSNPGTDEIFRTRPE